MHDNKKKLKDRINSLFLKYVALPLVLSGGSTLQSCSSDTPDSSKPQTETKIPKVTQATQDIAFVTDTLDTPAFGAMYYTAPDIIRNFVPNHNGYTLYLSNIVHEQKHKNNYDKKIFSLAMTPMQRACIRIDDEISATIVNC